MPLIKVKHNLFILTLFLIGISPFTASSQSDGDYNSRQTGDWNTVTTWQVYNSGSFHNLEDAGAGAFQNVIPSSASGVITMMDGFTVTVSTSVTADQIEYENNFGGTTGILNVSSTGTLIINNGSGDDVRLLNDFTTFALLQVSGTLQLNTGATLVDDDYGNLGLGAGPVTSDTYKVLSGGIHIHTTGSGVDAIPAADWQTGSTCRVNATASTVVPSFDTSIVFYNFVWDGSNQGAGITDLLAGLRTVNGDFTITSTNGNILRIGGNISHTLNIGGDFNIQGESRIQVVTVSPATTTINVNGNLDVSSTSVSTNAITFNINASLTLNVIGDFIKSGASTVSMLSATSGSTTLNLTGDFSLTGGTITKGASGAGVVNTNFNGTSTQTFTNSGTIANAINFNVQNLAILDLGTSAITGTGTFTLNSGGTILVGSSEGLTTSGSGLGNIQTSGTRTYAANGNIIYSGTTQNLGNEWGGLGALSGVAVNLELINGSVVTNNNIGTTNLVGILTLTNGVLIIGNSNTLTIQGILNTTSNGFFGGAITSNLNLSGTGATGTIRFSTGAESLNNFTISRSGTIPLGSDLSIDGTLAFTSTGNLDISDRTLTIQGNNGDITQSSSGALVSNNASNLILNGTEGISSIPFFGSGNELNNLTFGRTGTSPAYTWDNTVTINGTVNLNSGVLTHSTGLTMASGATFVRNSGASITTTAPLTSTSYNVSYLGNLTSGLELPSTTTALNNLTIAGNVALDKSITINGILTTSSGLFNAGANSIDLKGNFVSNAGATLTSSAFTFSGTTILSGSSAPTFGGITITGSLTPSSNFNVNGNLVNNGTLNTGSATVTFGGTTTISGSSTSSFNNIVISGALTAPAGSLNVAGNWTNNGTFTHANGTIVFNGTSSIAGSSATNFRHITISGTLNGPSSLRVAGNFTNNGTFTAGSGTVLFNGSATQLIQGSSLTSFNNIDVTNTAGPPAVRVASNQDLLGVLTLASNTIFDADGVSGTVVFRLRSSDDDPTVDASIATLPSGAVVQGNVTVQRYMSIEGGAGSNGRIYRYVSSPVQSAEVSQIQPEIPITGTFTGSSSCSGCGTVQSMFRYNETLTNGDISAGWEDFPDVVNSETLQSGRGYSLFVRGDINPIAGAGSALWDVRGTINSGTVSLPSTFTVDGWNLVGNPYPSTIDWDAGGWTKTNVNNAIYMRDNGLASPVFATYIGGVGANGGTRYIATGQAFWVRTSGAPTLQATESVKSAGTQTEFFKKGAIEDILRVKLKQGSASDEIVIRFHDDASDSFDALFDAVKLDNPTINISSLLQDETRIAINTLGTLSCSTNVKLDLYNIDPGFYELDFSEFESFSESIKINLIDNYGGTTSDIKTNTVYPFEVTANAGSSGSNRFSVSFSFPSFSTDYTLNATDVCVGTDAGITIPNAEAGIKYYATINGNSVSSEYTGDGSDLLISIPNGNLGGGENNIIIMASSSPCNVTPLDNSIAIRSESIYQISSVNDASSCKAGSVTLSAEGAPSNGGYKWYTGELDTDPILETDESLFTTPVLEKTQTYFVAVVNGVGCEGEREAVVAEIVTYDDVLIEEKNDVFSSSYISGNQWFKDGVIIPGATDQSFKPESSGLYKVEVNLGSCSTSAERAFVVTGIEDEFLEGKIVIYPNPTEGDLIIEFQDLTLKSPVIVDMMGRKIADIPVRIENGKTIGKFDFRNHPNGVYLLQVVDAMGRVYSKRISKK